MKTIQDPGERKQEPRAFATVLELCVTAAGSIYGLWLWCLVFRMVVLPC